MKRPGSGVYQKTYRNAAGERVKTSTWYIRYYDRSKGTTVEESSGSDDIRVAERMRRKRLDAVEDGAPVGSTVERTTLGQLADLILSDYIANGKASVKRVKGSLANLIGDDEKGRIGFWTKDTRAVRVDEAQVHKYKSARREAKAANATINRELACLRRMFRLGVQLRIVARRPDFSLLTEDNTREGFFEREEHDAICAELPRDEADVCEFMYWIGWRVSEVLALKWANVDEEMETIRITKTKNKTRRDLPYGLVPGLRQLISERAAIRDDLAARGIITAHVFNREGKRMCDFRGAWEAACVAAGFGTEERAPDRVKDGRLVRGRMQRVVQRMRHDYRRTAARSLIRDGVSPLHIMQLLGWKTMSMLTRYSIASDKDIRESLAKYGRSDAARVVHKSRGRVTPFRRRTKAAPPITAPGGSSASSGEVSGEVGDSAGRTTTRTRKAGA